MASALCGWAAWLGSSACNSAVIPVPGSTPTVLIDSGANVDCNAQMIVQFARWGGAGHGGLR